MANQGLFSKNAHATFVGIINVKLINKLKERGKIYEKQN